MQFAIIASERTGTHHLAEQLNVESGICCHAEILHKTHVYANWPPRMAEKQSDAEARLLKLRDSDFPAFLTAVAELRPCTHAGFTAMLSQPLTALVLDDSTIRKVVLYRQNILAQYASIRQSIARNAWSPNEMAEAPAVEVEFDKGDFIRHHDQYVARYSAAIMRLQSSHQDYLLVRHDELNEPTAISAVLMFLTGIRVEPRPSTADRQAKDVTSRFSNSEDVIRFLRECGKMHWQFEGESYFQSMQT